MYATVIAACWLHRGPTAHLQSNGRDFAVSHSSLLGARGRRSQSSEEKLCSNFLYSDSALLVISSHNLVLSSPAVTHSVPSITSRICFFFFFSRTVASRCGIGDRNGAEADPLDMGPVIIAYRPVCQVLPPSLQSHI